MEKVFPQAVRTDQLGFKSVSYMALIAPIVNSIKELFQKFLSLERLLDNKADQEALEKAEAKIADLEERLNRLETQLRKK